MEAGGGCPRFRLFEPGSCCFLSFLKLQCSILIRLRVFVFELLRIHYGKDKFAPKASRRPSQSFTANSRVCQGVLPSPRVNSTPRAAYSA